MSTAAGGLRGALRQHRRTVGGLAAAVAAVLAVVWLLVVPEVAADAGVLRETVVRVGHPLCWALLAVAALLWGLGRDRAAGALGWAALACYGAFLAAVVL